MSNRENIANNIITVLDAVTSPIELKKITREPFNVDELTQQQYPAIFIQSGNEIRSDQTMTSSTITREAQADFILVGFVKGTDTNIDTKLSLIHISSPRDRQKSRMPSSVYLLTTNLPSEKDLDKTPKQAVTAELLAPLPRVLTSNNPACELYPCM